MGAVGGSAAIVCLSDLGRVVRLSGVQPVQRPPLQYGNADRLILPASPTKREANTPNNHEVRCNARRAQSRPVPPIRYRYPKSSCASLSRCRPAPLDAARFAVPPHLPGWARAPPRPSRQRRPRQPRPSRPANSSARGRSSPGARGPVPVERSPWRSVRGCPRH